jgi:Fe-Mn family superoxide dismutase
LSFTLPPLPYAYDALAPHISENTMHFHYDKHHSGYVDRLNGMLDAGAKDCATIEEVVRYAKANGNGGMFNNAAQIANHSFFWNCMKPGGGGQPNGELATRINSAFGDFATFREKFLAAAAGRFGSGWAWLVQDGSGLAIIDTPNADMPNTEGKTSLLTVDVWEHAYYLDYQNLRPKFVETVFDNLINWDFVAQQLDTAPDQQILAK